MTTVTLSVRGRLVETHIPLLRIPPEFRSRPYTEGDVATPVRAEDLGPVGHSPGPPVEHLGQHRGGHRGEQRVEGGDPGGPGDAVPVEALGELLGLDGLPGAPSGEEPGAVGMPGAGHVRSLTDELVDE